MQLSGPTKKARDMIAQGWTSNAKRFETDDDGNVIKVCAQEAIDRCTPPGLLRRAVTKLVQYTSVIGGLNPGEFNDLSGMTCKRVLSAFDEAHATALAQEAAL